MRRRRAPGFLLALAVLLGLLSGAREARADRVDDLIRTLATTSSYKVKVQACLVLGKTGDKRARPILEGALKDENATVRMSAADALGKLGDRQAEGSLRAAANDPVPAVGQAARRALAALERAGARGSGQAAGGGSRFYISVGPLSNRSKGGGADAVRLFRESLLRELKKTPGVAVDGGLQKGQTGYYVDGNIVRLQAQPVGSWNEISCDLKVLVATFPGKSIIMWTDGGATVQVGHRPGEEQSGMRDCLEAAVQGIRENIATFLKAQQ